ncbi:zinc knuckle CX2CX4HX4C containing protein [Tanacetum coccineum]
MEARILMNGGITANGDPNEETGFSFVDLAKKIKNIDGKVLRKAVRGDVVTRDSPLKVVSFENDDLKSMSGLNTHSDRNDVGSSNPNPFSSGDNRETNRMNKVAAAGFDGLYSQDVAKGGGSGDLQQGALNNSCSQSVPVKVAGTGHVDVNSQPIMAKKFSFASVMGAQPDHKVVNLSELRNDEVVEGAAVTLPLAAVEEVNARFTNTLYGYFIGKRLAFKLVENYVKNTWAKFGIKRIQLHDDFFLFQFDSKAGMERVLETGPWLIRRVPLILNMWSPNVELKKDEVKTAPVWIKLHHVPIVAYTEVGLSLITTQIGKPIMLDSYTCNMCVSSWGRSSYARALIEVSAEKAFMESIVIAIPLGKDKGHSLATVEIEYEWKPPRCAACLVFDHTSENCPKKPKVIITSDISANDMVEKDTAADGFEVVKKKRNKKKKHQKQVDGVVLNKPSLTLHYRRVDRGNSTKQSGSYVASTSKVKSTSTSAHSQNVQLENSFSALNDDEENEWKDTTTWQHTQQVLDVLNESDSDVDEVITLDDRGCNLKTI